MTTSSILQLNFNFCADGALAIIPPRLLVANEEMAGQEVMKLIRLLKLVYLIQLIILLS